VEVVIAGGTDIGRKRGHNEDSYGIFPEDGVAVVADGMGGHAAGDVASRIAVDTLAGFVQSVAGREDITWPFRLDEKLSRGANTLVIGAKLANQTVMERAASTHELRGMGTTLVAALADGDMLHIVHVGDSRAYLMSGGAFSRLTVDHSFVEEQVQAGIITPERARTHPMRNIVTRALGIREELDVELTTRTPLPGDVFLLCTDGLSGMLDDSAIGRIIMDNLSDPESCVKKLIEAANERGGDDNITVVLIKVV